MEKILANMHAEKLLILCFGWRQKHMLICFTFINATLWLGNRIHLGRMFSVPH
jgi:hypothetical protein